MDMKRTRKGREGKTYGSNGTKGGIDRSRRRRFAPRGGRRLARGCGRRRGTS